MTAQRTYELYGARRSGSLAVELALAEAGVEVVLRDVDLDAEAQRDPAFAGVNPQRKLPALRDPDGELLTESAAILVTLAERFPDAGLLPPPASHRRARALRWLLFIATEIYPLVEINDYPERFAVPPCVPGALRERARTLWRERWLLVEEAIEGEPFLLREGCSVTDLYIAVVSRWAQQDSWREEHLPRVEAITRAVAVRPACAAVWRRHRPDDRPARFGA